MKKCIYMVLILFLWNTTIQAMEYMSGEIQFLSTGTQIAQSDPKSEQQNMEQILNTLKELHIAKGDEKGDFQLKSKLKREDAVILITRLLHEDVLKAQKEHKSMDLSRIKFKDVVKESYYAPYIAFAIQSSIVSGISSEEFGVGRSITQKEFAILLLRLLNYEVIWGKTDIAALSKESGLLNGISFEPAQEIDRERAFVMLYNSLFAKINKSDISLFEKRGFDLVEKQEKLEIKSAISKNLREVEIELNKPVSTYLKEMKVRVKNAHLGRISPRVSEDRNKLILSCGINMQNGGFYEFEIEGVYAMKGPKLQKTAVSLLAFDVKNPEIIRVEQVGEGIEVLFDEPISSYGKISLHPADSDENPTFPSLKNIHFREFGTKIFINGLSYEYDVDYIMNFSDYRDYVGKRGFDLEKEIRFQKTQK